MLQLYITTTCSVNTHTVIDNSLIPTSNETIFLMYDSVTTDSYLICNKTRFVIIEQMLYMGYNMNIIIPKQFVMNITTMLLLDVL